MDRLLGFYDKNGNPIPFHDLATKIQFIDADLGCQTVAEAIAVLKQRIADIDSSSGVDPEDIPDLSELIAKVDLLQTTLNSALSDEGLASPIGMGTFQDAYDAYKGLTTPETLFTWMLNDVDDENRQVRKVIYHVGNGEFIDAIGSRIVGNLSGITIVTKGPAAIKFNNNSNGIPLSTGINNFIVDGSNLVKGTHDSNGPTLVTYANQLDSNGTIRKIDIYEGKGNILDIDLGNVPAYVHGVNQSSYHFSFLNGEGYTNLRSVRRINCVGGMNQAFQNNKSVQYIEMHGGSENNPVNLGSYQGVFAGTKNLRYLDLKNLYAKPLDLSTYFYDCGASVYDLRNFDLTSCTNYYLMFNGSNVGTLIIGSKFVVKKSASYTNILAGGDAFPKPGNTVVVSVSPTPPVAEEPNTTHNWLAKGVVLLRIPPGSTEAYREGWPEIFDVEGLTIEEFEEGEYDYSSN